MQPAFNDGNLAINVRGIIYLLLVVVFTHFFFQVFLLQLLLVIAFLLYEVLLLPSNSLLAIPYTFILHRLFPASETEITLHPYVASGLLFVSVTTLVLFFASGMYSEKIAYANKYALAFLCQSSLLSEETDMFRMPTVHYALSICS